MMAWPVLASFIPAPIEVLGHQAELDDEVAGEVLRLDFAPLLLPQAQESRFIGAHDDPGVGAADELAPIETVCRFGHLAIFL